MAARNHMHVCLLLCLSLWTSGVPAPAEVGQKADLGVR